MKNQVYQLICLRTGQAVAGRNLKAIIATLNTELHPKLQLEYSHVHKAMSSGKYALKNGIHKGFTAQRFDRDEWGSGPENVNVRWIERRPAAAAQ